MAARRSTLGLAEGIMVDVPAQRPPQARGPPTGCALNRGDNSSAHYVAHRLNLRTTSADARCHTCGAPTSVAELWKALSALVFMRAVPAGERLAKPGIYVTRGRSSLGQECVLFTVVDEMGKLERVGDGSDSAMPDDAVWSHMFVDAEAATADGGSPSNGTA